MGWVTGVTWLLLAVAAGVVVLTALVSAGRTRAHLPAARRALAADAGDALVAGTDHALEPPAGSGIEWIQQSVSTEQIREHAHGRHEAQDG